jgi:DNA-directed RNA polymerase specialized sigma24 family protein
VHRLNEAVAAHKPRVEALAKRLDGVGGAEFDDLAQEGLIKVWHQLEQYGPDYIPSNVVITNAMLDWTRYCRRQGFAGHERADDAEG